VGCDKAETSNCTLTSTFNFGFKMGGLPDVGSADETSAIRTDQWQDWLPVDEKWSLSRGQGWATGLEGKISKITVDAPIDAIRKADDAGSSS